MTTLNGTIEIKGPKTYLGHKTAGHRNANKLTRDKINAHAAKQEAKKRYGQTFQLETSNLVTMNSSTRRQMRKAMGLTTGEETLKVVDPSTRLGRTFDYTDRHIESSDFRDSDYAPVRELVAYLIRKSASQRYTQAWDMLRGTSTKQELISSLFDIELRYIPSGADTPAEDELGNCDKIIKHSVENGYNNYPHKIIARIPISVKTSEDGLYQFDVFTLSNRTDIISELGTALTANPPSSLEVCEWKTLHVVLTAKDPGVGITHEILLGNMLQHFGQESPRQGLTPNEASRHLIMASANYYLPTIFHFATDLSEFS